jgi:hypothetical protein
MLLALARIDWQQLRLPDAPALSLPLPGLAAVWIEVPAATGDHALAATIGYPGFRGPAQPVMSYPR